jgi:hypothetical protein
MGRFLEEKDPWLVSVLHYYSQLATRQLRMTDPGYGKTTYLLYTSTIG